MCIGVRESLAPRVEYPNSFVFFFFKHRGVVCFFWSNLLFLFLILLISVQRIVCSSTSRRSSVIPNPRPNLNRCRPAWLPSNLNLHWWEQSSSPWSTTTRLSMDHSTQISSGSWCSAATHQQQTLLRTPLRILSPPIKTKLWLMPSKEFILLLDIKIRRYYNS